MNIIIPFAAATLSRRRERKTSHSSHRLPQSGDSWSGSDRLIIERRRHVAHALPGQISRALCGALHARIRPRPSSLQSPPPVQAGRCKCVLPRQSRERATNLSLSTPRLTQANCISILFGSDRGSPRLSNSPLLHAQAAAVWPSPGRPP